MWADATVRSVDETSNEFTVWITEWDSLPEDDPAYEPAYEEGPYNAVGDDEWRRPAAADDSELDDSEPDAPVADVPVPHGAVIFDAAKHVVYDYDAEAGAVEGIAAAAGALERPAGMDNDDKSRWAALNGAVETLYRASADSPAPPVAEDPRLCGDWECVGCTSSELAERRGLTGLGSAPFTKLGGLFFSYQPSCESGPPPNPGTASCGISKGDRSELIPCSLLAHQQMGGGTGGGKGRDTRRGRWDDGLRLRLVCDDGFVACGDALSGSLGATPNLDSD